ncbi:MAG: hypothetical protein COB60_10100 [Flavobacteriaceae bacterium]|nr:MAG: hypothetical protein COB60_10100 [Flavobacteriaceae bacterium]
MFGQRNQNDVTASFELQEIALLGLEPRNTNVVLGLAAPSNSGDKAAVVMANNSKWLNFTSAVRQGTSGRNISVKIEDGNIPKGLVLKLKTTAYQGGGKGDLGSNVQEITLGYHSQVIVKNIGGAFTGNGSGNGYKLTYFLEIQNYDALDVKSSETITVSLTLSDF